MLGKIFKSWKRREDGVTAIEFSMLLAPFMMLTLGIIEIAMMYTSASMLEGSTNSAARLIRTGQLQQSAGAPEALFRTALCDYATIFINCNDVVIEVQPLASFNDFSSMGAQYDADGNLVSRGVDAGGANDRILIRTAYRYNMLTPIVGDLITGGTGSLMFMSTIVLQTEPYDFDGV